MPSIHALVSVLPDRRITRANLSHLELVTPPARRSLYQDEAPKEVRRATAEDGFEQLAAAAGRQAIDAASLSPADIDLLITAEIAATGQPLATLIQSLIGLAPTVPVQALQNGSCGMVDALSLAGTLVESGRHRRVLVVAATVWDIRGEGLIDPTDPAYGLFGDAAAAAVVGADAKGLSMLAHRQITDGSVYLEFGAKLRPRANPMLNSFAPIGSFQVMKGAYVGLSDAGLAWFETRAPAFAKQLVGELLAEASVAAADVRCVYYMPFGAAGKAWAGMLQALLPQASLHHHFETAGWAGAAGPWLPLTGKLDDPDVCEAGSHSLVLAIGEGGQLSAMLLRPAARA